MLTLLWCVGYGLWAGWLGLSQYSFQVHLHFLHSKDQGQRLKQSNLPVLAELAQWRQDNYCNRLKVKREFAGVQSAAPKGIVPLDPSTAAFGDQHCHLQDCNKVH